MDLYEYQGKALLREAGIPVPEGMVCDSSETVLAAAESLGGRVVVKAQVRVGGRGKAGGIAVVEQPDEARRAASRILGMNIKGHRVERVLVERATTAEREMYAAFVLDRGARQVLALLSSRGGMEVEELSRTAPEALARVYVDPLVGLSDYVFRRLVFEAGIEAAFLPRLSGFLAALYGALTRFEATLVEVNPLALTTGGQLLALDAKVTVDNNALFRQPELESMREADTSDPQERMAREKGLTYVKLDGDIGVLGNGAGLVMSTLDLVANVGGRPANFLDVGGGARAEEIVRALEVVTSDPKVRVIFFNIFGGITRCDEVARGIVAAVRDLNLRLPIVVRLDGTNEQEGRKIVSEAGLENLCVERTMMEGARQATTLAARAVKTGVNAAAEEGLGVDPGR